MFTHSVILAIHFTTRVHSSAVVMEPVTENLPGGQVPPDHWWADKRAPAFAINGWGFSNKSPTHLEATLPA